MLADDDNLRMPPQSSGVKLSPEDLRRIDAICPVGAAAGTRYPQSQMSRVNV